MQPAHRLSSSYSHPACIVQILILAPKVPSSTPVNLRCGLKKSEVTSSAVIGQSACHVRARRATAAQSDRWLTTTNTSPAGTCQWEHANARSSQTCTVRPKRTTPGTRHLGKGSSGPSTIPPEGSEPEFGECVHYRVSTGRRTYADGLYMQALGRKKRNKGILRYF